ncbi:hypothetical protein EHM76_06395 [bacterium]|nr:MAG: hypothetical protein EHM76_06395 [bacterium]
MWERTGYVVPIVNYQLKDEYDTYEPGTEGKNEKKVPLQIHGGEKSITGGYNTYYKCRVDNSIKPSLLIWAKEIKSLSPE